MSEIDPSNIQTLFRGLWRVEVKSLNAYVSIFDGELNVISSLQSLQITLELAVVEEDLLHHVSPLNEPKGLLKDDNMVRCDHPV